MFPLQLLEGRYHLLVRVPQNSRVTTQDVVRASHTDLSDLCVLTFKWGIWADGP